MFSRHQLFTILHCPSPDTRYAAAFGYLLTALIVLNCVAVSLETVEAIYEPYRALFRAFEIVSTLIFLVEYLARLWVWAVVTLTTIGYGDIAPITPMGQALTSVIVLFGIGIFALPTAILTAAVFDAGNHSGSTVCPHCNGPLDDAGLPPA